jgi:hypothetical protein
MRIRHEASRNNWCAGPVACSSQSACKNEKTVTLPLENQRKATVLKLGLSQPLGTLTMHMNSISSHAFACPKSERSTLRGTRQKILVISHRLPGCVDKAEDVTTEGTFMLIHTCYREIPQLWQNPVLIDIAGRTALFPEKPFLNHLCF